MGLACTVFAVPFAIRRQRNHAQKTIGEPCAGKLLARFERRMGKRARSAGTAPLTTNVWTGAAPNIGRTKCRSGAAAPTGGPALADPSEGAGHGRPRVDGAP